MTEFLQFLQAQVAFGRVDANFSDAYWVVLQLGNGSILPAFHALAAA